MKAWPSQEESIESNSTFGEHVTATSYPTYYSVCVLIFFLPFGLGLNSTGQRKCFVSAWEMLVEWAAVLNDLLISIRPNISPSAPAPFLYNHINGCPPRPPKKEVAGIERLRYFHLQKPDIHLQYKPVSLQQALLPQELHNTGEIWATLLVLMELVSLPHAATFPRKEKRKEKTCYLMTEINGMLTRIVWIGPISGPIDCMEWMRWGSVERGHR